MSGRGEKKDGKTQSAEEAAAAPSRGNDDPPPVATTGMQFIIIIEGAQTIISATESARNAYAK